MRLCRSKHDKDVPHGLRKETLKAVVAGKHASRENISAWCEAIKSLVHNSPSDHDTFWDMIIPGSESWQNHGVEGSPFQVTL